MSKAVITKKLAKAKPVPYATTLRVKDCCLCLHVQRAARALARRFDEALKPFDLTNGQWRIYWRWPGRH